MQLIPKLILAVMALQPAAASAAAMLGVNLAGAEASTATMPGRIGYNYVYPDRQEIDLAYGLGVRLFRLPLREDRIQDGIMGPLRPEVRTSVYPVIDYIRRKPGAVVLIDWHSFGKRQAIAYGTAPWDAEAIIDLNTKFMAPYRDASANVWLGLQNEPVGAGQTWWHTAALVVQGLRGSGLKGTIVVAGSGYSAANSWAKYDGPQAAQFHDPGRNIIFEAHSYFDANGSGTGSECVAGSEARLDPAINHARQFRYRLLFGELAVADSATCDTVRSHVIARIKAAPSVVAACFWALGSFYTFPHYKFGLTGPDKQKASLLFTKLSTDWAPGSSR
jgi:endoglucanase